MSLDDLKSDGSVTLDLSAKPLEPHQLAVKGSECTSVYMDEVVDAADHTFTSYSVFGRAFSEVEDRLNVLEGKIPEWPRKKMRQHVNEAFLVIKTEIDNMILKERRNMMAWAKSEMADHRNAMRNRVEQMKNEMWEEFSKL